MTHWETPSEEWVTKQQPVRVVCSRNERVWSGNSSSRQKIDVILAAIDDLEEGDT